MPHIAAQVVQAFLHPEHAPLHVLIHLSTHAFAHDPVHEKQPLVQAVLQSTEHVRLQLVAQLFLQFPVHAVQEEFSVGIYFTTHYTIFIGLYVVLLKLPPVQVAPQLLPHDVPHPFLH